MALDDAGPAIRAVIFDLDGTLLDSEEGYYQADRLLLERFGIAFTREEKRRYIGGSTLDMMIDLKARYGLAPSPGELADRKNALYLSVAAPFVRVFPPMRRFLTLVRGAGLPTALATGSSPGVVRSLLASTGLSADLPVTVSAEEVARGKPWPDVFEEAARRLGVPAEACLAVEDSWQGVEAANRAGMRCLAVPFLADPPLPEPFRRADLLFEAGMSAFDPEAALAWVQARRAAQ